jgi:hypothetical protein
MTKLSLVGEQKKEAGRNKVEANNEEWLEWMRFHAKEIARWTGCVTIDALREIANDFDRQPSHPNAWGCVFRNKKQWERIAYIKSKRPEAHARPVGVWKWKEQDHE